MSLRGIPGSEIRSAADYFVRGMVYDYGSESCEWAGSALVVERLIGLKRGSVQTQ